MIQSNSLMIIRLITYKSFNLKGNIASKLITYELFLGNYELVDDQCHLTVSTSNSLVCENVV